VSGIARVLRFTLYALLILIPLVVIGGLALVATEPGTRWLVAQAERHAPVELRVEQMQGSLFRGLTLTGVTVLTDTARIQLQQAALEVDASALLRFTVWARHLRLSGVRVDLLEAPEPAPPTEPPELPEEIRWPLRLVIEQFLLTDLTVHRADATLVELERLALRLDAEPDVLRLSDVDLVLPDLQAQMNAELRPEGAYPLHIDGHWRLALPEAVALGLETRHAEGTLTVDGNLRERLHLQHELRAGLRLVTDVILEEPLDLGHLHLDGRWEAFAYRLDDQTIAAIDAGALSLGGTPQAWTATLTSGVQLTDLPAFTWEAHARGSLEHLEIDALHVQSSAGRLAAEGRMQFVDGLSWDLQARLRDLSAQALGLDPEAVIQVLDISSTGTLPGGDAGPGIATGQAAAPEDVFARLTVQARIQEFRGRVEGQDVSGTGWLELREGQGRVQDLILQIGTRGQVRVEGEADLGELMPFRLSLAADHLDLDFLVPERALTVDRLRVQTQGRLERPTGVFSADVNLQEWRAQLDGQALSGTGRFAVTDTQTTIEQLDLALPAEGRLRAQGRVGYASGIDWELDLEGHQLDPGVLSPELPGQLALRLRSQGHLPPDDELHVDLQLRDLSGAFRGQPVEGRAAVQMHGRRIQVEHLDLGLGDNRLTAQGLMDLDDTLAFDLNLQAPQLHQVHPLIEGGIELTANVAGTMETPRVTAQGQSGGIRYGDYGVASLHLELDAGLDPQAPAEGTLRLSGLTAGADWQIETLRFDAQGTAAAHTLALDIASGDLGRFALQADGGVEPDPARWSGRLTRLDIDQPLAGTWALRQPVPLRAGAQAAQLDELCLDRGAASLCLQGQWSEAAGARGQGVLQNLDLAWLEPLLPPAIAFNGQLDARFQASTDADGDLQATLAVEPTDGVLQAELVEGIVQSVPYRDGYLTARIDQRAIRAEVGLSFLEASTLEGQLNLDPEDDSYRMAGQLRAELETLEWAGAFSPDIQNLRGRLQAALDLGGRLDAPQVEGRVQLADAGVSIPEAGLDLEVPRLVAEVLSIETIRIEGEVISGGESLRLTGDVGFPEMRPQGMLRIQGTRFLAVNRPDAQARITPDLRIEFRDEGLAVRGAVQVPTALLQPPDLPPGAITVSGDEVVVGEEPDPDRVLPIDVRVRVVLGDDVRFEGFDVEARFVGDLDVQARPQQPLQVFGEIEIREGTFDAYGQDLELEYGLVLFQGPPDTPLLDLRAVRRVPRYDVVVGVEIGGLPNELSSTLFSEPTMEDTEIMAFLLTGRPLSGATASEGNIIANAAATWGLEQAGLITERVGSELGLDELTLDVHPDLDRSALTIGKFLTPSLLLRYSVGLFDDSSKVMLRYELTRSLSLETSSSAEEQGVDLIWRIER